MQAILDVINIGLRILPSNDRLDADDRTYFWRQIKYVLTKRMRKKKFINKGEGLSSPQTILLPSP